MITRNQIFIEGVEIALTRKKMRSISIRVCVPDGEVRASASARLSESQVLEFIKKKIDWIKDSRAKIRKLRDEGKIKMPPKFISGEEHLFGGKKFCLEVIKNCGSNKLVLSDNRFVMMVKGQSNIAQRQKLFDGFYRNYLREIIPAIIDKYEKNMGVEVVEFGIKKMKTRWGTCNVRDRRIWLGLELAKKPHRFLESIVVHEMTHLLEPSHNKRFYELMDKFMPDWRILREDSKSA